MDSPLTQYNPMSLKPIIKSAREAIDRKDFSYALQLCTDALEFEPENYWLLVFKAVSLGGLGDPQKALLEYGKAVKAQPENPTALQGIVSLYESKDLTLDDFYFSSLASLTEISFKQGEYEKHLALCRKRINLYKQDKTCIQKCIELLEWLRSGTAPSFYPEDLLPDKFGVLKEEFTILSPIEASTISKEIETGRMRLGADSPERLVDRVHVHNFSAQLTKIIRELALEEPETYLEQLCERLFRIVLSDYCNDEKVRQELANELLGYSQNPSNGFKSLQSIRFNVFWDDDVIESSGPRAILNRLKSQVNPDEVLKLFQELEGEVKRWKRAFPSAFSASKLIREAEKYRIKALLDLKLYEDALQLINASKLSDEDLLEDFLFESVLEALEACSLLQRSLELIKTKLSSTRDTDSHVLHLRLIDNLIALKQYKEAQEHLSSISELSFDAENQARVSFSTGLCSWYTGNRGKSQVLSHFLQAAKTNPLVAHYFTWIGLYYWRIEGDTERSTKCLMKALTLDPSDLSCALLLAEIKLKTDNESHVFVVNLLEPFTRISAQSRSRRLFYYYGTALFACKRFLEASTALQSALKGTDNEEDSAPPVKDENCLQWIGEAFLRSKRLGSALRAFTRLAEHFDDENVKLIGKCGLAAVYAASKAPIEVIDSLEGIRVEFNEKVSLDLAVGYLELARHYIRQGRFISASQSILKSCFELDNLSQSYALRTCSDALLLADSLKNCFGFPLKEFEKICTKLKTSFQLPINPGLFPIQEKLVDVSCDEMKIFSVELAMMALSSCSNSNTISVYWLQLGCALSKIDGLREFSISALNEAINSGNSPQIKCEAHHLLALLYTNDQRRAQHHFISALKCFESAAVWIDLGRFYATKVGDWELAGESFRAALAVDSENLCAAHELARLDGTCESAELALQVAQRAFSTQPVHFTEDFALSLTKRTTQDEDSLASFAQIYLHRWNPNKYKDLFYNESDEQSLKELSTAKARLDFLNSRQDPHAWSCPLAKAFDCEFLLKRPENEVAQSGWRAVVEGLLPETRERTRTELKSLEEQVL